MKKIKVLEREVSLYSKKEEDYICLTDIARELYSNVVAGEERTGVSLVENVETRRAARTPQPGGYAHAAG